MKKYGLLIIIFIICICLNYNPDLLFNLKFQHWGEILSFITSVIIIVIMRFRDPSNWSQKLGINFNKKDYLLFIVTTILLLILSYWLVDFLSGFNGYEFKPKLLYYQEYISPDFPFLPILGSYIYYIPETFNEEMLVGALLLMGLERNFIKLNKNVIVIGVALIFSLMHQGLYWLSPVQSGVLLTFTTISSLVFVGILRNVLIIKTRKIVFSWAIHLSFNLIFFAGFYVNKGNHSIATEPERFNIIFGHLPMFILTGLMALSSLIWLNYTGFNMKKATGYNII